MKQQQQRPFSKRLVALAALAVALVVAVAWDRANQATANTAAEASTSAATGNRAVRSDVVRAVAPARDPLAPEAMADAPATPHPARRLEAEAVFNPFGALGAVAVAPASPTPASAARQPASVPMAVVTPAAPAGQTAPPLPFVAVGLIAGADVTGGPPVAFLQQQERVLLVKVGDDIAKTYRVESISAERIEFTFLPLQQRQVLTLAQ